ncbi:TatD family hydrolase [Thorsellia kenyensis]|uniref:TatD family hydrolase n=1 Tax=Thorsellia kenyensis TaxID=1549888 RepID=A0ABV6C8R7_9GAMM
MNADACEYPLFDTHAHLNFPPFSENIPATIKKFQAKNIQKVFIPATKASEFVELLFLAHHYEKIFYVGLGLHPYFIPSHLPSDIDYLSLLIQKDKASVQPVIKAIGEIGLDAAIAKIDSDLFKQQCNLFRSQLILAKEFNLPVVIHSRKTHSLILTYLKKTVPGLRGVIHGFSGSYEEAMNFIKLGFMIGVGSVITYSRANKTRRAIAKIPLEWVVLETDSPDMPPSGQQGTVNRSENLVQIFSVLCALRQESRSHIAKVIWGNSQQLTC